jgi:hypothetical protein
MFGSLGRAKTEGSTVLEVNPETVKELRTIFQEGLVSGLAVQDDLLIENTLAFCA